MLTLAKIKEQKVFFVHFRKLLIESNVYAKFKIHTTCRQKVNLFYLGGERGEGNFPPFMKPTYMKKLMRNRAK